jgi:FKBP-type peptidyl-prolyl cis-trans isomerase
MGERDVVSGLELGMIGMRKGGRRFVVVPPQLGSCDVHVRCA